MPCSTASRLRLWRGGLRARSAAGGWLALVLLLPLLLGCAARSAGTAETAAWRGAWGTALFASTQTPEAAASAPAAWARPLRDVGLRQKLMASVAGSALRVQISNQGGRAPLVVAAAALALAAADSAATVAELDTRPPRPLSGSLRGLLFAGKASLTLAPGETAWSDAVLLDVPRGAELLVDLQIVSAAEPASVHPGSRIHAWAVSGADAQRGDYSRATRQLGWWYLNALDVRSASAASPGPVLVAIGDSITDGYGVAPGSYQRWTDRLVQRLQSAGIDAAVINTGIGGNRMLRDGLGPSVVSRFGRDALERSGVSHAVLLIGVNDLGVQRREGQDTPPARAALLQALQDAWRNLAQQARRRGVCLLAATVLPYGASGYYKPGPDNEADRVALNDWIRSSGEFDAVVDFDALVRDPAQPERMQAAYDSGDGLHPSMAGYAAMAQAFPVERLATPCPAR